MHPFSRNMGIADHFTKQRYNRVFTLVLSGTYFIISKQFDRVHVQDADSFIDFISLDLHISKEFGFSHHRSNSTQPRSGNG